MQGTPPTKLKIRREGWVGRGQWGGSMQNSLPTLAQIMSKDWVQRYNTAPILAE